MTNQISLEFFVAKDQEGKYLTLPFEMPLDTEAFSLSYAYERHHEAEKPTEQGRYLSRQEINIIDLGLIAPDGSQAISASDDNTLLVWSLKTGRVALT